MEVAVMLVFLEGVKRKKDGFIVVNLSVLTAETSGPVVPQSLWREGSQARCSA